MACFPPGQGPPRTTGSSGNPLLQHSGLPGGRGKVEAGRLGLSPEETKQVSLRPALQRLSLWRGLHGDFTTVSRPYSVHATRGCSSSTLPFWKGLAPLLEGPGLLAGLGQGSLESVPEPQCQILPQTNIQRSHSQGPPSSWPCPACSPSLSYTHPSVALQVCPRSLHPLNKHLVKTGYKPGSEETQEMRYSPYPHRATSPVREKNRNTNIL